LDVRNIYLLGVTTLYITLHLLFASAGGKLKPTDIPMLLVGYGFGASFVALFMQLGGGIYTKVSMKISYLALSGRL
jgi:Na+/H+-translocating membrane pyrophosphatase